MAGKAKMNFQTVLLQLEFPHFLLFEKFDKVFQRLQLSGIHTFHVLLNRPYYNSVASLQV